MLRALLILPLLLCSTLTAYGQGVIVDKTPKIKVTTTLERWPVRGLFNVYEYRLVVEAVVPQGYHIYSMDQAPGGPIPTIIQLNPTPGLVQRTRWIETPRARVKYYDFWPDLPVKTLTGRVRWVTTFKTTGERQEIVAIVGTLVVFPCSDTVCYNPQEIKFRAVSIR